jgi:hypothetical protein
MQASRNESTAVRVAEPDPIESIAAALDMQSVGEGSDRWVVHVLGIHGDGHHIWVQLASDPDGRDSFVLRLSAWATADHALAALATLRCPPDGPPSVVPVMCTV